MSPGKPFTAAFFETLYEASADPWSLASNAYEQGKYAATLAALPRSRFGAVLEVGCSIGLLTSSLATRADRVLAVDIAEGALCAAREHCRQLPQVRFARMQIPEAWPEGRFDLVLFSEVLYYLSDADIKLTVGKCAVALSPSGAVVLVNWIGPSTLPVSGEHAAEQFIAAAPPCWRVTTQRQPGFRIDVLQA